MITELFLAYALALPSPQFTWPRIVSYCVARSEEERLRDWIHKYEPGADIFIHPNPQRDKLKEAGYEQLPITWRGNEIWIQRKPKSDRREHEHNAERTSA